MAGDQGVQDGGPLVEGVLDVVGDIAEPVLGEGFNQALDDIGAAVDSSLDFAGDAIDTVADFAGFAVDTAADFAGDAIDSRYLGDWALRDEGAHPAVLVRPRTSAEIAAVLRECNTRGVPVVAQGGRTGLTGGATPCDGWVIVSL